MCLCQNINPFSLCRFALLCNYNIASLLHQTTTEDQATATAFVWFEATAESTATTVHHIIRGRARGIWTQKHHVQAGQPLPLMCNYNIASLLHQTTTEDQATATTFVWLEATSESTATTVHHIIWGRAREIWTPTTSRAGRAAISTTTTKSSCQVNWAGSQQLYSSRPESVPLIRLPPALQATASVTRISKAPTTTTAHEGVPLLLLLVCFPPPTLTYNKCSGVFFLLLQLKKRWSF